MADAFHYRDDQYVLNYCTKYLARYNGEIAESWRFPVIDSHDAEFNDVTFIYAGTDNRSPGSVGVIGTFATLYQPIPLRRVRFEDEDTRFWSVSYAIPKGQTHRYRFVVDGGVAINDPVNPQEEKLDNGAVWSRFFTDSFSSPLVLEKWEIALLYRLTESLLPFRTAEAENFLERFYNYLDRQNKEDTYNNVYRLDTSVGEINYIDNILAREERHHLVDYKICLRQIDRILRTRNPYTEPSRMSKEIYVTLYDEMAADNVSGWDRSQYGSPQYFLYLLRRHAVSGAFSHPKYGGNAGGAGWAYLSERYTLPPPGPGQPGQTLFNWRAALEAPLGTNADYLG